MSQKPQIMDKNKQNVIENHYLHILHPNWSLLSLMIVWGLRFASFTVVGAFGRNMGQNTPNQGQKNTRRTCESWTPYLKPNEVQLKCKGHLRFSYFNCRLIQALGESWGTRIKYPQIMGRNRQKVI